MVKQLIKKQIERKQTKDRADSEERKFQSGELKEIIFGSLGIALIFGGSILITPHFPIVLGALLKIIKEVKGMGLGVKGVIKSPLVGPKGNIEYFIYLKSKDTL